MSGVYRFREYYIPERMMGGLLRYVEDGIQPGDFLVAILRNDLTDAVAQADEENMRNLPAYAAWLYNEAPRVCWGSEQAIVSWIVRKRRAQQ